MDCHSRSWSIIIVGRPALERIVGSGEDESRRRSYQHGWHPSSRVGVDARVALSVMAYIDATVARPRLYEDCTEVSPQCPVKATTLGYYPNKGVNVFIAICFIAVALATLTVGIRKRTWTFMVFVTAGCILEFAGYVTRVLLHDNPWDSGAFRTQIVAIILGPTLICVSIYVTLKHVCLALNPTLSRVAPTKYPYIFIPADVSCLLVQAIGGSIAASAGSDKPDLLKTGNRTIIAGICLQVVVLAFFGLAAADYWLRVKRWIRTPEAAPGAVALYRDRKFRMFVYAVTVAFTLIFIRCIYRIAEMAGGWGNHIMQDEPSFVVLESFMVAIACILLAAFPPGYFFPQMVSNRRERRRSAKSPSAGNESPQDVELVVEPKYAGDGRQ
ncbi:hypothetical protein DL546_006404 [Coniochaeta pulveracea]|uniref:Phospholipid-translocating ATPase rsb1 n=1 Tax=Coniochaeta pulveracea TaxID=177199 RepID=A0A420YGZ2_9PEZI|nr:hypothetical protein DL546_006404 [Coniochaeta pulveracea]